MLATVGCASKVDLEAEQAAIREADRKWSETGEAKDVEGFVSFLADDASFLPPNFPPKMFSRFLSHDWQDEVRLWLSVPIIWETCGDVWHCRRGSRGGP